MSQTVRFNIIKLWIIGALRAASTAFLAMLSVYFLRNGMSEVQISFHSSLSQVVNLGASLLFAGVAAGFRSSGKARGMMLCIQAVLTAAYAIFCVWNASDNVFFIVILLIAAVLAVVSAVATIFDYKLPCEVMDIEYYSVYAAYAGLFSGAVGMVIGMLLPLLYQKIDFSLATGISILLSALCLVLAAIVNKFLKLVHPGASDNMRIHFNPIDDFKILFSDSDFRALFFPNLIRGFGTGITALIAIIAIRSLQMPDGDVSLITAAANIGTILSSFLYVFFVKRIGIPKTGLVGALIWGVSCLCLLRGTAAFLILYCIAFVGKIIFDNALPDMIYQTVDAKIISPFHTWRLAITALGTAASTPIYAVLLDTVPTTLLFVFSSLCFILCALGYYIRYRKRLAKRI